MRALPLAAFLVSIAACHEAEKPNASPSEDETQRIEAKLAQQECVGDLSQWERRYQYWTDVKHRSPTQGRTYYHLISFKLRRGTEDYAIPAGRFILPAEPSLSYEIDDRPGYSAGGWFDTTSGKVTMRYCEYSEGG
jgi:hypothetical protein